MEKLKQLPIRVKLELLEEELRTLLEKDNWSIQANRKDEDGDYVTIDITKK